MHLSFGPLKKKKGGGEINFKLQDYREQMSKRCQDWHCVALFTLILINPVAEMTPLTPHETEPVSHATALSSSPSRTLMDDLILQNLREAKTTEFLHFLMEM